jgi:PTH1 family peptidyl-tRNA hydrolase
MSQLKLIVGLGNPGPSYSETRHNAGQWFVEELARQYSITLKPEVKFFGLVGEGLIGQHKVRLLIPTTFMNNSGQAFAAVTQFYKISLGETLVAHDELDFEPGLVKLKSSGGHGGHNGLRDIIARSGNQKDFHRLRIGIGHPGNAKLVSNWVLKKAPKSEQQKIISCVDESARLVEPMINLEWASVMNELHSFKA